MNELLGIGKELLDSGVLGALVLLLIFWVRRKDGEIKECQEKRIEAGSDYRREMMELEREYRKEQSDQIRMYDASLNAMENTLQALMDQAAGNGE